MAHDQKPSSSSPKDAYFTGIRFSAEVAEDPDSGIRREVLTGSGAALALAGLALLGARW